MDRSRRDLHKAAIFFGFALLRQIFWRKIGSVNNRRGVC